MIHFARLIGMLKPTPSLPPPLERIAMLIPMISPFIFTSGPPEFPGLIAASVWRKSWFSTPAFSRSTSCRPRPLMIPWLTEWFRPNGLPIARTHEPTGASSLLPSRAAGRSVRSSLSTAMSALLSSHLRRVERPAVAQEDVDLAEGRARHDVVVGQDEEALVPLAPDDHARAGLLELGRVRLVLALARLVGDQVDHRRRDRPGDQLERPVDVLELGILAGELAIDRPPRPAPGSGRGRGRARRPRSARPAGPGGGPGP